MASRSHSPENLYHHLTGMLATRGLAVAAGVLPMAGPTGLARCPWCRR